jgi:hypothetical protein
MIHMLYNVGWTEFGSRVSFPIVSLPPSKHQQYPNNWNINVSNTWN